MDKTPATGAALQVPLATAEAHLPADGGPTVQTADAARSIRRFSRGTRRALVIAVAVLALAAIGVACWEYLPSVYAWLTDAEAVRAYVADHAVLSRLAMVGINALQVLLAFLPGEPVELASGYAFGFLEGTLLCLVASAVASTAIFAAVRAWGWRVVGLFFDRSHLERFGWLNNVRKLELVMLIVFLIPALSAGSRDHHVGAHPLDRNVHDGGVGVWRRQLRSRHRGGGGGRRAYRRGRCRL